MSVNDFSLDLDALERCFLSEKERSAINGAPSRFERAMDLFQSVNPRLDGFMDGDSAFVSGGSQATVGQVLAESLEESNRYADGELVLSFADFESAIEVFEFAQDLGLAKGEVVFDSSLAEGYGVRFAPHIRRDRNDVMSTILDTLMNKGVVRLEDEEVLRGYLAIEMPQIVEFNPLHDPNDGKFTSPQALAAMGAGSWSADWANGPKQKVDGTTKNAEGKKSALFARIDKECGRLARSQGFDKKCSASPKKGGGKKKAAAPKAAAPKATSRKSKAAKNIAAIESVDDLVERACPPGYKMVFGDCKRTARASGKTILAFEKAKKAKQKQFKKDLKALGIDARGNPVAKKAKTEQDQSGMTVGEMFGLNK